MQTLLIATALLSATPALAQRDPGAMLSGADANGDGAVTRAEFQQSRAARFDKADRNRDGALTRDDFKRLARFRPEAVERLTAMIAEMDANGDGRLTRDELASAPMPVFDRADSNHDGVIDATERAAFNASAAALREKR